MKPHVTVFMNGGEPFIAMHISWRTAGLWRQPMFEAAAEVLKELVLADYATLAIIGDEAQKAWDAIKTTRQIFKVE